MSNLLKQSIADAKAVRATALANATAQLQEAFQADFKTMFAEKLREDATENLENPELQDKITPPVAESTEQPTVTESTEKDKVGGTNPSGDKNDTNWGKNGDPAAKPTATSITPATIPAPKDGGDATKTLSKDNKGDIDGTPKGVNENMEMPVNEDLEEIIKELEAEANSMNDAPGMDTPPAADAPAPDATAETPEEDANEIKSGDTVVITKAPAATEAEPVAPETPPTEPETGSTPPAGLEEIDLNELLQALNEEAKEKDDDKEKAEKDDDDDDKRPEWLKKKEKVDESIKSQLNEAISQRNEAYKTVEYLRTQINEINLLNAKLLYTNKLFKEFNMPNDNKMKIVEAFDLTKNVREVKLTYANWCNSLNFGGNMKRSSQKSTPNVSRPNTTTVVTEGYASKPVASTKPTLITENSSEMAMRFKKLAGIRSK